jgi:hypothetical protein
LRTARNLGQALFRKRDWHSAGAAYESARAAFLVMFGQGLDEMEARDLIENAGPLFAEAAYAATEMGNSEEAFSLLNEGKARLMAVALRQQTVDLSSKELARLEALKAEIGEQSRLVEMTHGIGGTQALQRLVELRRELGRLLEKGLPKGPSASGVAALARTLLAPGGAIVAPIITGIGGKILIISAATDGLTTSVLDLPDLTTGRLDELFLGDRQKNEIGGWLGAYTVQYLGWREQT